VEIVTFAEIQKVKSSFEFKNSISSTRNCNEFRFFDPRFTSLIWCIIKEIDDGLMLQSDLDNLVKWSDKWLFKFNIEKCKVMHLGHKLNTQYYMKEEGATLTLATTEEERDLGVIISSNLKPSAQCLEEKFSEIGYG